MSAQLIALNRFGLGARSGEAGRLSDPLGWLLEQARGDPPTLATPTPGAAAVGVLFRRYLEAVRSREQERVQGVQREVARHRASETRAVLTTRVVSERPFAERWVAFWSNHLCISSTAGLRVAVLAGSYERDVIRAHAFGRFDEMLLASARHPAMLQYLDNAQSVGPNSRAAQRPRRGRGRSQDALRGLNENYARELLELHTMGVDGGYTQADVEQLARVLTGWTVRGAGGPLDDPNPDGALGFRFVPELHEPGAKTVLGQRYHEGEAGGVAVIRALARRRETARFLATKLATHFVDDAPPPPLIDALTERWLDTEGDLGEVAATLLRHGTSWDSGHRKFRTPQDWLVALLRVVEVDEVPNEMGQVLRQLRHPLWAPPSPKGFGDLRREWADSDSLMNRAELARTVAVGVVGARGARRPSVRSLATVVAIPPDDPLPTMLADESIAIPERVALLFAGPAFQWR